MGTAIELCIHNVSISYSKNFMGNDYGFFFISLWDHWPRKHGEGKTS